MKIYEITGNDKAKVTGVKKTPNGDEVTIDQDGVKTTINTEKNPNILATDPKTGDTVYNKDPKMASSSSKRQSSLKPGTPVKVQ